MSFAKSRACKALERDIRNGMAALRDAIRSGDDSNLVVCVLEGKLACAQRPLRYDPRFGGRGPLLREAKDSVVRWVQRIVGLGFRSVICLCHPKELRYYDALGLHPNGLVGIYEASGLEVVHLPWLDPAPAKTPDERARRLRQVERIKFEAKAAFDGLLKPVLVHCSAGIDRSPPVAAFIAARLGE